MERQKKKVKRITDTERQSGLTRRIASKSAPTLLNAFLTSWTNIFLNNIDLTRSLMKIILSLVIHAWEICSVLFQLTIKK